MTSNASLDRSHGWGEVVLSWGRRWTKPPTQNRITSPRTGQPPGEYHSPRTPPLQGQDHPPPPGQDHLPSPPGQDHPLPIRELRSMCGRYTSYWNAILYQLFGILPISTSFRQLRSMKEVIWDFYYL